uniref:Reticulon-like protein n=1 Tax=Steinernema glaseri TaxID=37863 RepID=A0A1I7ZA28_9BILA
MELFEKSHWSLAIFRVVYWRDPKKSGAVLAAIFVGLYVFATYPLLIVLTYTALAVLAGTFGFRVFKLAEAHFKKVPAEHPFKEYLAYDLSLESDKVHAFAERAGACAQKALLKLRSVVFVEDLVETSKALIILWTLTYVGAWFSGLTLVVLAVLAVFSVPKVYELYKEPIDEYLELAQNHFNKIAETVYDKVPMLKKSEHPQEPVKKDE